MSNVPDGAHISDDGNYWWDGENWQPIDHTGGGTGDYGQAEEKSAAFDFGTTALLISPEGSGVESAGEPLKVSFSVCNTGTAPGKTHVVLWIDGVDSGLSYDSPELAPGDCTAPDDGYIHDIPGQSEGRHKFEVFADPPGPYGGWTSNEIDIRPPET